MYHKDFNALKSFKWAEVLEEMTSSNPELLQVLLAVSVPKRKQNDIKHLESVAKNVAVVYGILMKARWKDLLCIQRLVSMIMFDERVHQKVFDRLQPLGVCVSHSVSVNVLDTISGHFQSELIDSLKEGKRFRIVGDNVNFTVDVSHLRQGKKQHMEHWFGSAALIQNMSFDHLSSVSPQENVLTLPWDTFLPNEEDWNRVRRDYTILIMKVLLKHIPAFKPLSSIVPKLISTVQDEDMAQSTKIIPLPVLAKNEQKYSEVIDVLDSYEDLIAEIHQKAGIPVTDDVRIHIGGDQLTRERFSGAKRLRGIGPPGANRFLHLSPITFEFFHLQMALLSVIFATLYNDKSTETGTLGAERIRLGRKRADGKNVRNHFEDCKELAVSLVDVYILEAACHFFGLENLTDKPTKNIAQFDDMNTVEQLQWMTTTIGKLVDTLVWPHARQAVDNLLHPKPSHHRLTVIMPNGRSQEILIPIQDSPTPSDRSADKYQMYAHNMLELGLLFKDLSDAIHCPDRERMISILKLVMLACKGKSTRSKYALEILRFLCHQLATLSEKVANESFYGCFVNTGGKLDTHIPADMAMEHLVRNVKNHIRALHSNKSEQTIKKRTGAFAGLSAVSTNYDVENGTVIRSQKHKTPSADKDERVLFDNVHRLKPFCSQTGRVLGSHSNLSPSILTNLTRHQLQSWISEHQVHLKNEIGQ